MLHQPGSLHPDSSLTQVSPPVLLPSGQTQFNITGGTRPGGTSGTNLFHSFGDFNVPTNNIANFLNNSGLATSNILGRVTGGNLSNIFGTIQTTGFGNANLFLMNPTGFLFGPNATVNVGGMVSFTSADYLRLTDGVRFNAIPNTTADALLSASPVAAFGFLGSNPGAITVQGSQLSVTPGQSISLVGGNITVQSGVLDDGITTQPARLAAPGGQINLASVASPGEILLSNLQSAPNVNGQSFTAMGNISLSEGALLDVSADAAGTVRIRGGQLVINDAAISADTVNANGATTAVVVDLTGNLSITDTRGIPAITARTTGAGDGGEVAIKSGNLTATSSFVDFARPNTIVETSTSGTGKAGNVTIETGNLSASGTISNGFTFIDTGTFGAGHGGDIAISADSIKLNTASISTGDLVAANSIGNAGVSGSGGNLAIKANSLELESAIIATTASGALGETQVGGDISLNVRNIAMRDSILDLTGPARNGTFTVNADTFRTNFTFIQSLTAFQQGGNITVNARVVELTNGSAFISTTLGDGNAGDIQITATDHVRIVGDDGTSLFATVQPSGLFSNSFGDFSGLGNAGNITITTPRLELLGGRINTVTQTSGRGGNVTLNVSESISISGEFPTSALLIPAIFDIGPLAPSGIVTSTIGGVCPGPCGKAGDISITTGSLSIQNGGRIDSGTSSNGPGGNIALSATDVISLSGTSRDGTPVGLFSRSIGTDPDSGSGGNIELHAGQYQVTNGAQVSASTLGPGTAGNVFLEGASGPAQTVLIDGFGSGVFTDTQGTGAGGNILMNANTITLQNGGTLSATTSGTATSASGGTITVDANQVQVNSGGLITASTTGAGAGGLLNINAASTFSSNAGSLSSTASQATGGDVSVTAGQSATLINGASISASSTGAGNAGNIQINAGNQLAMTNSKVTTEANQASGGAIKITTNPNGTVQLTDSTISASVLDGTGGGGSVNIDPQYVVLQNSQILANAVFGPGGNINITTNLLLPDSTSLISASSQFGQQGTIIIQSPISPASGKIIPLGQKPLLATTLLSQRCAALAGGNASSFTVAGRDALPVEPGGWLSSPLAFETAELVGSTATEPETRTSLRESTEGMPIVSLRRIAPPGFLIQSFAADGTTGCTS